MSQESRPEFGTTKEISARFGMKPQTWRKLRGQGSGPRFVKLSLGTSNRGKVLYRYSDVEKWLADRTVASTAEVTVRISAQAEEIKNVPREATDAPKELASFATIRKEGV